MESLRILLARAAIENLEAHQMDVVSAYLLGELEEDVYLSPPKGLDVPSGKVLKLKKGLPGLKQSGRVWNQKVVDFFERQGLRAMPADHSVFANEDRSLVVALYVDDLVIIVRTVTKMLPLKEALLEAFQMKDLGEVEHLLGMRITRDRARRTLMIDQKHYIQELVREHGTGKTADVPASRYDNLVKLRPDESLADVTGY